MPLFGGGDSALDILVRLKDEASEQIKKVQQSFSNLSDEASKLKTVQTEAAVAMAAFDAAVFSVGKAMINASAELEQLQIGFTTLLGSGQKATLFMRDLKEFAATTPFEMPGVANMATRLLAAGYTAEETKGKLLAIGDAASAIGMGQDGANRITLAITQMANKAKLSGQEIKQLNEVGINGFKLLSEQTGIATTKLIEMSENGLLNGKVAADLLADAMERSFGGAMQKQSQTFNGLWSTLVDNIRFAASGIGDQFLPALKDLLKEAIKFTAVAVTWIDGHKELVKILGLTVVTMAVLGTVVVSVTGIFVAYSVVAGQLATALSITTTAARGLLLSMGLWTAVAAAVVATLVWLADRFGGFGKAMEALGIMAKIVWHGFLATIQEVVNKVVIGPLNGFITAFEAGFNLIIKSANKLGAHLEEIHWKMPELDSGAQWDDIQKEMDKLDQMQADAILEKSAADQKYAQSQKEVAKQTALTTEEMKKNLAALTAGVAGSDSASKSATSLANKQKDLADAIQKTQQTAKDELKKLADDHADAVQKAGAKIDELKGKLKDLQDQYNKEAKSDSSDIADKVVAQEQKIADLKKQISKETDSQRLSELQTQLSHEQKSYDDNYAFIQSLGQAYLDAKKKASETEFQRAIDDYNAKRKQAQEEFDAQKKELEDKLALEQKAAAEEVKTYELKVSQINALLDQANAYQLNALKGSTAQKIAVINQQIEAYNRLADAMNRAAQGKATQIYTAQFPTHEFGGTVQGPEGMPVPIIAHGGEKVIPARQASTTMTGGGNFSVTINNPIVRSDKDVTEIKRQVEQVFRDLMINNKL